MKESPRVWLTRLKHEKADIRYEAKLLLGGLTPDDADYVPELIQALKGEDSECRFWAATALACIGSGAKDAVPEMIDLLQDQVLGNRQAAAHSLGCIGLDADPAVPALEKTLQHDRNQYVRREVVRALGGIGTQKAVAALIGALNDPDPGVRRCAVISVKILGSRAKEAIPALRHIMTKEKDQEIRRRAEAALRLMGFK